MALVKPFRGVVYNMKKIKDARSVMAPPYDIIPPATQETLYRKHPQNIIRLELGRILKTDSARNNRYTRAGKFFTSWLKNNTLIQDEKEAFYIYGQEYTDRGRPITRIGVLGLMSFGGGPKDGAMPHEKTLKAPKEDRLNLMREVKANLSPIFVLFEGRGKKLTPFLKSYCASHRPLVTVRWDDGRHKIWRLDDPAAIEKISAGIGASNLFIADGHHRFETAKNYARELAKSGASRQAVERAKALMVYFVESDEKMLTVLPAHRLPRDIGTLDVATIMKRLEPYFTIEKKPSFTAMMRRLGALTAKHAFGMYAGEGRYYILRLKDPRQSDRAIKDKPKDWKRLDVSILHFFIFRHVLGIKDTDDNVEFVKDPREAARMVDRKELPLAFFLNPTKAAQVRRIARLGERMPRKATYFYPKPLTGLVINRLAG